MANGGHGRPGVSRALTCAFLGAQAWVLCGFVRGERHWGHVPFAG
jgi:hypothetical protein